MVDKKAYFEEGDRHNVIVENVADMEVAEQEADRFLKEASDADEGGTSFVRVKVSGIKRGDRYYFKAVMVYNTNDVI